MADDDIDDEETGEGAEAEGDSGGRKPRWKSRKVVIVAAAALVVLLAAGGGAAYFLGLFGGHEAAEEEGPDTAVELGKPVYYDLPEMLADLKTGECRAPFLKFQVTIQVYEKDVSTMEQKEMKIVDRIHQHLRSKTRQDLVGKEGAEDLRADLVLILNDALAPSEVHNVLFKQFVLQ